MAAEQAPTPNFEKRFLNARDAYVSKLKSQPPDLHKAIAMSDDQMGLLSVDTEGTWMYRAGQMGLASINNPTLEQAMKLLAKTIDLKEYPFFGPPPEGDEAAKAYDEGIEKAQDDYVKANKERLAGILIESLETGRTFFRGVSGSFY